ncbi:MAG: ferritin-like domain-containing protein [Pseudomarimonas sp.]
MAPLPNVVASARVSDLQDAALACLLADSVESKLALSQVAASVEATDVLHDGEPRLLPLPGRPAKPELVSPRQLAQRGLGTPQGRAAFIHAIAHIEFNAINLAWDAVYRFRGMPLQFYRDWSFVAADETRHFSMLNARLHTLGFAYGDFDAHNGLWEMAVATQHSCLERMALVPRVLEARGLDVTPAMIERLQGAGDKQTADALRIILREEVAHVAIGSRWFAWCCEREGVDAATTFTRLIGQYARGALRGPFNRSARLAAGFSAEEIDGLEELTNNVQRFPTIAS